MQENIHLKVFFNFETHIHIKYEIIKHYLLNYVLFCFKLH